MNLLASVALAFAVLMISAIVFFTIVANVVCSFNAMSIRTAFYSPKLLRLPQLVSDVVVTAVRVAVVYVRHRYL